MNATWIYSWYGEQQALKELLWRFPDPVDAFPRLMIVNDGWLDGTFTEIVKAHANPDNVTAVEILADVGFNSHGARNLGAHLADPLTDWFIMLDMDCVPQHFQPSEPIHRGMFWLTEPVEGYKPFKHDIYGLTKSNVHPNCHMIRSNEFPTYPLDLQGVHDGDEDFFDLLEPEYDIVDVNIDMVRLPKPRPRSKWPRHPASQGFIPYRILDL